MRKQTRLLLILASLTSSRAFGPSVVLFHKASSSRWPQLHSSVADDLTSLTVPELKGLLKGKGCKVSGRKAELIQRLEAAYAIDTDVVVADSAEPQETAVNSIEAEDDATPMAYGVEHNPSIANELSRLTVDQLKKLLQAQGSITSGNKDDLVLRLAAVVAEHRERQPTELETPSQPISASGQNLDTEFDTIFESSSSEKQQSVVNDASSSDGFEGMNIPRSVLRRLTELNFKQPTPIQRDAIPVALNGIDVMGLAQTGTGKTLAFGIPLVSKLLRGKHGLAPKSVSALVLAPTRELANQIADELKTLTEGTPVSTYAVYGGAKISTQINRLEKGVHILVSTPGRLVDLMYRRALSLADTRFLVLDESDMMLDMGFAPDLEKIANELPSKRQTMLFSATMSKAMSEVANVYLNNPVSIEVARTGMTAEKITQEVHFITKMDKMTKLTSLMNKHEGERTLVFGRTKHGMEKLCQRLNHAGIKATSIHGNKSQPQRDRAIRAFKSGDVKVLVATDVAARGLDIPEVKHVYNYELPDKAENYVHRIGRTARAGEDGASISFCSAEEMKDLAAIEELLGASIPVASGTAWEDNQRFRGGNTRGRRNNRADFSDNTRRMYR